MLRKFSEAINVVRQDKKWLLLILIFVLHVFLRFYDLEGRASFGWDQVDNAWAAKNIIVDHHYPLFGMVAKGNSGFYIGPAYYYLVAIFYYVTNLDPVASALFAGATSIFTFLVLFYITKKIFGINVALITVFIHTFSFHIIQHNRVQWPINFVDPLSLIIFYALYNIVTGKAKYILLAAVAVGFSFHIHFTSIFYLIIILLTLPLFPRTKEMFRYILLASLLFFIWFIPHFLSEIETKTKSTKNMLGYLDTYYHGFHLRRMLQLGTDAFIEFESILWVPFLKILKYFFLPLFASVYYFTKPSKERFLLCYLVALWFVVPWLVFTTYKGEISNYYFFLTRPFVLIIFAYLTVRVLRSRYLIARIGIVLFWLYYAYINTSTYMKTEYQGIDDQKNNVKRAIKEGRLIDFTEGDPQSYIYYIYMQK